MMKALAVLAILATPAFAEHAASTDPCAKDATCFARSLATTLTADEPAPVASDASRTVEMRHFVDFAPGRVRVFSKSRAKVEAFVTTWKHHGDWSTITVHGYAGATDEALAQRRAEKIRGYLIRYGVPAARVVAVGHATPRVNATAELSIELCSGESCHSPR